MVNVIYDVSRLSTRALNATPNGIDWIDALLADYFVSGGAGPAHSLLFGFRGPRLFAPGALPNPVPPLDRAWGRDRSTSDLVVPDWLASALNGEGYAGDAEGSRFAAFRREARRAARIARSLRNYGFAFGSKSLDRGARGRCLSERGAFSTRSAAPYRMAHAKARYQARVLHPRPVAGLAAGSLLERRAGAARQQTRAPCAQRSRRNRHKQRGGGSATRKDEEPRARRSADSSRSAAGRPDVSSARSYRIRGSRTQPTLSCAARSNLARTTCSCSTCGGGSSKGAGRRRRNCWSSANTDGVATISSRPCETLCCATPSSRRADCRQALIEPHWRTPAPSCRRRSRKVSGCRSPRRSPRERRRSHRIYPRTGNKAVGRRSFSIRRGSTIGWRRSPLLRSQILANAAKPTCGRQAIAPWTRKHTSTGWSNSWPRFRERSS